MSSSGWVGRARHMSGLRIKRGVMLESGFRVGQRVVMAAEERRVNGGGFGPPYEGIVTGGSFDPRYVDVRRTGQKRAYRWHADFWHDPL